jgi:hypothetical protein
MKKEMSKEKRQDKQQKREGMEKMARASHFAIIWKKKDQTERKRERGYSFIQ